MKSSIEQAIAIIDQIQICGFPDAKKIATIESLCKKLEECLPKRSDLILSAKLMREELQQIKDLLEHRKEIPIKMYEQYNIRLIILKENLISSRDGNQK